MTEHHRVGDEELIAQIEGIGSLPLAEQPAKLTEMEGQLRLLLDSVDDQA